MLTRPWRLVVLVLRPDAAPMRSMQAVLPPVRKERAPDRRADGQRMRAVADAAGLPGRAGTHTHRAPNHTHTRAHAQMALWPQQRLPLRMRKGETVHRLCGLRGCVASVGPRDRPGGGPLVLSSRLPGCLPEAKMPSSSWRPLASPVRVPRKRTGPQRRTATPHSVTLPPPSP